MTVDEIDYYEALGLQLIPLWGVVNGRCRCRAGAECQQPGKHPKIKWRGAPSQRPVGSDNVGVCTDPLVVLDFDTLDAAAAMADRLDDTFVVQTLRGVHVWYRADPLRPVRSTVGWRPHVDVRAVGGLVVAPPSRTVVEGRRYSAVSGIVDVAPCPPWLLDELPEYVPYKQRTYHGVRTLAVTTNPHFRPLVDQLISQMLSAVSGTRNLTLFKVASRLSDLVHGGYVAADARDELVQAALQMGLQPDEIERTMGSAWKG